MGALHDNPGPWTPKRRCLGQLKFDFPSFLVGFVVYIGFHFVITYKSPSHNYAASSATLSKETCRQARVLACLTAANVSPSSIIPQRPHA
jgi:hypothetical protein